MSKWQSANTSRIVHRNFELMNVVMHLHLELNLFAIFMTNFVLMIQMYNIVLMVTKIQNIYQNVTDFYVEQNKEHGIM